MHQLLWDSQAKTKGTGGHFLVIYIRVGFLQKAAKKKRWEIQVEILLYDLICCLFLVNAPANKPPAQAHMVF